MLSASTNTFCRASSTCCSSFESVTTPTTERCQVSSKSSSATATLKCARRRSFKLRKTCRLSFSDCASAICNSSVSNPTGMASHPQAREPDGIVLFARGGGTLGSGFCGGELGDLETFQNVANLDVVEVRDTQTAFKSRAH